MYRTASALAVLSALDSRGWRCVTPSAPGAVARTLRRLRAAGLVESRWEVPAAAACFADRFRAQRARRLLFRLTPAGVALRSRWLP
jgi:DNA-binding PadR family transcriptional regulator